MIYPAMMDVDWSQLTQEDVCLEPLLAIMASSDEPVPLTTLTQTFVKEWLAAWLYPVTYQPTQNYQAGTFLRLPTGQIARIKQIAPGYNPKQGNFQVLAFAAPGLPCLVAGLEQSNWQPKSTSSNARPDLPASEVESQVRQVLNGAHGPQLRNIVHEALQSDKRLVSFENEWWLAEKLPHIATGTEIAKVHSWLRQWVSSHLGLSPVPVIALIESLWQVSPIDATQSRLATFCLNCVLGQRDDFYYLRGEGWILKEQLPELHVQRQPRVPHIRSTVVAASEAEDWIDIPSGTKKTTFPVQAQKDNDQSIQEFPKGVGLWQDLDYWQQHLSRPEAKVKLLGQHYIDGFLPLHQDELRRVIPPSSKAIEVAWFIFRQADNTEARFQVTVDFRQEVVIGGSPLRDYLASQGILPGCYLYIHRRSDTEYDIYPRLLPQPAEVECKFARIDESGQLVTENETIPVQYEHDPDYLISETRLEDMAALWCEANKLGLSFFDILVKHIFPRLAPNGEAVHWEKLWTATFFGYRMGSRQAIQRELRRDCFITDGKGNYRYDPKFGYGFSSRTKVSPEQEQQEADVETTVAQTPVVIDNSALPVVAPNESKVHLDETVPEADFEKRTTGKPQNKSLAVSASTSVSIESESMSARVLQPIQPVTTNDKQSCAVSIRNAAIGGLIGGILGGLTGIFLGALIGTLIGAFVGTIVGLFGGGFMGLFIGAVIGVSVGLLFRTGSRPDVEHQAVFKR